MEAASLSTLSRAIAIAAEAHEGQVDKAGEPYVLHALRVMLRLSTDEERIVGVLHDVVEDTDWDLGRLRAEGFSDRVLEALAAVTKRSDDTDYEAFVSRAAADPIGRRVKLADLHDNCDLSRIADPSDRDHARIEQYRRAIAYIERLP
jgi:(p)ppGpp synthase/HD superfamily hydrolase